MNAKRKQQHHHQQQQHHQQQHQQQQQQQQQQLHQHHQQQQLQQQQQQQQQLQQKQQIEATAAAKTSSISQHKFPDCANEALQIIGANLNRIGKTELTHLANEYIFFNEFKHDQNIWVKKTNSMQDLQCVDCIVNFLEAEKDANICEFVFEILFNDLLATAATNPLNQQKQSSSSSSSSSTSSASSSKFTLQLLISYAISLESKHTLECVSKWIIHNIGNELVENIFDQLVLDHFLLINELQKNLINLGKISPLFSSLFMTIVLDMLANGSIKNHEKCVKKLFNLFEIWIQQNAALPLMAFKSNLGHVGSYMLNPLPGLLHITIIYPLKYYTDFQFSDSLESASVEKLEKIRDIEELASKVHLMSLKLIQSLASNVLDETAAINTTTSTYNLINASALESILKKIYEYNKIVAGWISRRQECESSKIEAYSKLLNKSMDKLGQLIILCSQFNLIGCSKQEVKNLYLKYFDQNLISSSTSQIDQLNLFFQILFNN